MFQASKSNKPDLHINDPAINLDVVDPISRQTSPQLC